MARRDDFLHAIAASPDDDGVRLVFSDWLDEQGDSQRAEFIRVQCELAASASRPGEGRRALRARERELLDAHRHAWCQALGLAAEDVSFSRGLVAALRLSEWREGKTLDVGQWPWLGPVTELDLSGLQLGDDGVATLVATARLPALRKMILSNNGITDVGAAALAGATGLPRLETLYLFDNPVGDRAHAVLEQSPGFRLTNLDVGTRAEGYCLSPGEADVARRQYVRSQVLPVVARYFTTHERLQSAMLCVAQYWADEADDAVHAVLIVSELLEPTLEGLTWGREESGGDPNLPNTPIKSRYGEAPSIISLYETDADWDDNSGAIPLWAAFAPEGGSQEYEHLGDVYAPAVMFFRHGGYEFLPMLRPHLNGVRPE